MINQGNAATFIDDIIMTINTKKEHNELVEEILKKLEKTICLSNQKSVGGK